MFSNELTKEYGSGFTARNLRNYRQIYMYYTDNPNVFPQQKLEIPYNILFMLKTSIYTLFKVNIEFFISSNCQKKRIIQTNYPFFG